MPSRASFDVFSSCAGRVRRMGSVLDLPAVIAAASTTSGVEEAPRRSRERERCVSRGQWYTCE